MVAQSGNPPTSAQVLELQACTNIPCLSAKPGLLMKSQYKTSPSRFVSRSCHVINYYQQYKYTPAIFHLGLCFGTQNFNILKRQYRNWDSNIVQEMYSWQKDTKIHRENICKSSIQETSIQNAEIFFQALDIKPTTSNMVGKCSAMSHIPAFCILF